MTTSDTVLNSENYTSDKKVLIDICEDIEKLPTNYPNCDGVYVCHVPKYLSSLKLEAFIPQFVGLGPYHHFRADLIMTRKLKLGVAKRVLKLTDNKAMFHQRLQNIVFDPQLLYHIDVHSKYDHHILLHVLIVDGLFLFALLHSGTVTTILEGAHNYFLTGKPGMPLVNAAGLELNMCGVIKDVFMIENQIPTHVLKLINQVLNITTSTETEIQSPYKDLGSAMQFFCEAHCPLIHLKKLAKIPENHHHLLDLMYHLVTATDPDPELESEPQSQPHQPDNFDIGRQIIVYLFLFFWIIGLVVVYLIRLILQVIVWLLRFSLGKVIPSMAAPQSTKIPSLTSTLSSAIDMIHSYLLLSGIERLKPYTRILSMINERTRGMFMDSTSSSSDEIVILPSATELSKNAIIFEPAVGGSIASVKFDETHSRFYLPCIRLDLTSGVIIRNLLAYESLMKFDCLIFARFIKLMSNLVVTAEDVKLLVNKEIIKTKLSDGVIAQFFNVVARSVNAGPKKSQKFEQEIKKVKDKFDGMQNVRKMFREFFIPIIVFAVSFILLSIVASPVVSVYCTFYPSSRLCTPPEVRDYGWQR